MPKISTSTKRKYQKRNKPPAEFLTLEMLGLKLTELKNILLVIPSIKSQVVLGEERYNDGNQ